MWHRFDAIDSSMHISWCLACHIYRTLLLLFHFNVPLFVQINKSDQVIVHSSDARAAMFPSDFSQCATKCLLWRNMLTASLRRAAEPRRTCNVKKPRLDVQKSWPCHKTDPPKLMLQAHSGGSVEEDTYFWHLGVCVGGGGGNLDLKFWRVTL